MLPSAREDYRYQSADYCPIRLEEKLVFAFLKQLKKTLPPSPALLDLGCGSGAILKKIQELGFTVKGYDFSTVAVAKAQKQGLPAAVANLDDGIPETANSYNVILAGDILEHLFDPMFALQEARRVLAKGGYLLLTIPNDVSIMVRLKTLFGISYQEVMYRRSGIYKHHTFFTWHLLNYMLAQAHFLPIKQQRITNLGHYWQLHAAIIPLTFTNEFVVLAQSVP